MVNLAMGWGVIIRKKNYLLFSCFRACRSFLSKKNQQEKNGNRLIRGYTFPPPYWQIANIFPVFSYEGFPKQDLKFEQNPFVDSKYIGCAQSNVIPTTDGFVGVVNVLFVSVTIINECTVNIFTI